MQKRVESYLRAINSNNINILTFPTHERYQSNLESLPYTFYLWQGNGIKESGIDRKSGKTLIEVNEKYFRPAEVETLLGDASKAKALLGWEPKTSFEELVDEMCISDLQWAKSSQ